MNRDTVQSSENSGVRNHSLPVQLQGKNQLRDSPIYCGCTDQVAGLADHGLYIALPIFKVFYLLNERKTI